MTPGRPKSSDGVSPRDSFEGLLMNGEYREDLEAFLRRDMRARVINRVLRAIRIVVECVGFFLSIPAAIIEIIAACYIWDKQKTMNWAMKHREIISTMTGSIDLFAYFWMMAFTFATFPVLRKRFPAGWRNDLLAIFTLLLMVLPMCVGIEVFHHIAQLTAED